MSEVKRNPYEAGTPTWQLWENAASAEAQARAWAADADNYQRKSQQARERAQQFWAALKALESVTP